MNIESIEDFILKFDESQKEVDWSSTLGNFSPINIEIGPGKGDFIIRLAQLEPEQNFIGIERRLLRVLKIASKAFRAGLNNIRVINAKGEDVPHLFVPGCVNRIFIHFPDPWPKRSHIKRRIFNPPFLDTLALLLRVEGEVFITTDVETYANYILSIFKNHSRFKNLYGDGFGQDGNICNIYHSTIHEMKFKSWGRKIYYLHFCKSC